MTQKKKAKAYEEDLEKARQLCGYPTTKPFISVLQDIFPELQESDDEKIRKTLIRFFKDNYSNETEMYDGTVTVGKALAWLEKQGEQKQYDIDILEKHITKDSISELAHTVIVRNGWEIVDAKEQKTVDKVEPKFHEGDWVVFIATESVYQVEKMENYVYTLRHIFGGSFCLSFSIEELIREWTIQDAKDGDVLACPLPKGYEDREQIFIFKGINSRDYVDNCIEYYCRICDGVFYENENGYMGTTSSPIYPATKEQRDTLLKAMTDAGWEFDFEKKELKKIDDNEVKGRADVLRNIDPDEMVADFCSQPLSKTRSLASIYRQGIKDLLKKINNNEKTSITGTRSIDDGGVHRA